MTDLYSTVRRAVIGMVLAGISAAGLAAETFDSTIADTRNLAAFKVND